MRYAPLASVNEAIRWAQRLILQLERDYVELRGGKGQVTLTANATTTTLTDANIKPTRKVLLMPTTANAAAALATTYLDTPGTGTVVINHANNAQTDRTFNYLVMG